VHALTYFAPAALAAADESPGRDLRLGRRIPDATWSGEVARLVERGVVAPGPDDAAPALTSDGEALHAAVEHATDRAAAGPWEALGPERTARLADLLAPVAAAARTVVPARNPIGVPRRRGREGRIRSVHPAEGSPRAVWGRGGRDPLLCGVSFVLLDPPGGSRCSHRTSSRPSSATSA
jgi:helix-turn-helix protein